MVKSVNTNKVEMDKKAAIAVVFENPEFGKIRTLTDENGEPLFCAKDVCDILGYKIARCAVRQLVNTLDVVKHNAWVVTGKKKDGSEAMRRTLMLYVNESGFYALVLGSKLSTAVKFKNWVTADVLPQIRKTGGYIPVLELHGSRKLRAEHQSIETALVNIEHQSTTHCLAYILLQTGCYPCTAFRRIKWFN